MVSDRRCKCIVTDGLWEKHVRVSALKQIYRSILKIPYLPMFPDKDRQTLFVVMKVSY